MAAPYGSNIPAKNWTAFFAAEAAVPPGPRHLDSCESMQVHIPPDLIVIVGPTGVGKSPAAVCVAERLGAEIISADSRQVYQGMDIGTAKPGPDLRRRIPHHLIDVVPPDAVFSAGRFRAMARQTMDALRRQGKTPIVVGGTGLYVRALLYGLWEGPGADWNLRRRLIEEERTRGSGFLHDQLREVDPDAAARIHPGDRAKTLRALEVAILTGRPLSSHHEKEGRRGPGDPAILIGLSRAREDLYRRIDRRVEDMMRQGFLEEVERLLASGLSSELPAMRGLGYRQLAAYLRGQYSLRRAVELIQRDTRRFAKRQMTWFRAERDISWVGLAPGDEVPEAAEKILERCLSEKARLTGDRISHRESSRVDGGCDPAR